MTRMAAASSALQSVEVYTKGTKAWFEDKLEAWISATCISNTNDGNKVTIVFEGDNDQKVYKEQTRSVCGCGYMCVWMDKSRRLIQDHV